MQNYIKSKIILWEKKEMLRGFEVATET